MNSACIALLLSLSAVPTKTTVIAVFPFEDTSNKLDANKRDTLSDYLAGKLGAAPGVSIVPKGDVVARIKSSQVESYQACFDESCQIEIGKALAASKVVAVRVAEIGSGCLVSAYLFDLARQSSDATASERTTCDDEGLLAALDRVADRFSAVFAPLPSDRAERVQQGALRIVSNPSGAAVVIDGEETGDVTPATVEGLAAGNHDLTLETDEATGQTTVTVTPGATNDVRVELSRRPARLDVRTQPPGAQVQVNGENVGLSPVTVNVPEGPVTIEAATADRSGRSEVVARAARQPQVVSFALEEIAEPESSSTWLVFASVAAGLVVAGLVLDLAPSSAHNGRFDGLDVVPVGLYGAGITVAVLAFLP